jgi:oligopeptide transport system ATP-binding protein
MTELLKVQDLKTQFLTRDGTIHAVNGVSFNLNPGETLGIVGESGCGKSVSVMSILRLIQSPPGKVVGGKAMFDQKDLMQMSNEEIRQVRGSKISMIFQDPMTSFNPVLTIGRQLTEPLEEHMHMSIKEAHDRAVEMLQIVGIPNPRDRMNDYPHQFSGGMRQRVMIAMALTCNPQILIADEPTTALDVTIQAQILDLVKHLRDTLGMAIIWITHDLGIIARLADRVTVMYAGYIIEEATVREFYKNSLHPYSIGLLGSLPRMDMTAHQSLVPIEGLPPVLFEYPSYCPFISRCRYKVERCSIERPDLIPITPDHRVACWVDPKTGKERQ